MNKFFKIILFLIIFIFYWNLSNRIENRTEAEDIYEYATMVEEGNSHHWFYHKHHLIFGPTMHYLYKFINSFGYQFSSLDLMRLASSLAATATLFLFFLFCYKRYSLRPISSALATFTFGIMYGFVRYSAEAEIPIIATFFMIGSIYFLTSQKSSYNIYFLGIILSIISVLMHIMNAVAVFVALPLFLIMQSRFKFLIIYLIINISIFVFVYYSTNQLTELFNSSQPTLSYLTISDFLKGIVAFLQSLISFDFVLGFSFIREYLGELFPTRMLQEEFYFGERLKLSYIIFSSVTFILLTFVSMYAFIKSIKLWNTAFIDKEKLLPPDGRSSFILPIIFFISYASLLLFIEPGNPELWVMGLMPFALLLCGLIFVPLTYDNKLWVPFLAVILLFIHNTNALSALQDSSKDYNYQKSKDYLKISKKNDVVLTAANPVFERHLRYHSLSKVIYLYNHKLENILLNKNIVRADNIYILGDVFNTHSSMKNRFPKKTKEIEDFSKKIKNQCFKISENEFGGIYKLIIKEKK